MKTVYVTNRREWRSWLSRNHNKLDEIWLVYYKKDSGKPRIPYNDAVEEALCYGWIDSTVKGIDKDSFAQRFTPRKPKSNLSQMNKERVRELITKKKMTKAGLKAIEHVFGPEKDMEELFIIAADILKALKSDEDVWKNFQNFPERYKRIRIGYIENVRKRSEEEFQKRLRHFIKMTAKNKRFGYVKEMM